jgi:mannose-6-phosphate isomerase-like protein (cupin superfamily)
MMKILKKQESIQRKNSEICVVTEYPLDDETIDFAIVKVSGRYPSSRSAVNRICKEIIYIKNGSGKVFVEGNEYVLHPGDLVLIEAGEKFYWEGNLELFISCRPAFSTEQHEHID